MKLTVLLAASAFPLGSCSLADTCSDDPISSVTSPDDKMVAVLVKRDCGATTDYSYQVAITGKKQKYNDTHVMLFIDNDIVFTADSDHGKARAEPLALVQWKDSRHLLIKYDDDARIFRQKRTHAEVAISYETLSPDEFLTAQTP